MTEKLLRLNKKIRKLSSDDDEEAEVQHQLRRKTQKEQTQMHAFGETGAGVPAFLAKLWRLVDDPETNNLICWSKDGRSFIIQNQAQFARELLPLNYKHNNMASFIRQLNMYGFHKITSIDNGGLKFDRDEMEFSHPCFKRNYPHLLEHIKRKISNTKNTDDKSIIKSEAVSKVLQDFKALRGRQDSMDSRFSVMKQENEALWREIASLRQKHAKQQQIVNKLIQFLLTIVQPSRNMSGVKRHMQLMIHDTPENSKMRKTSESESECGISTGPVIHEFSEELLDEVVADNVGALIDPTTVKNDNECLSPVTLERPQSSISLSSQSHDYSNQSADDLYHNGASANSVTSTTNLQGTGANSTGVMIVNNNLQPQVVYHVTEMPDAHPEVPLSPYNDDNNVLTTPMVREEEARTRLLKKRNKERRRANMLAATSTAQGGGDIAGTSVATASKIPRASRQQRQSTASVATTASTIKVKTEPDMDPMLYLSNYSDNTFMSGDSNLISPNSQHSGEESRQSANALNSTELITNAGPSNAELYEANFISNDMPTDLFEDASLLNDAADTDEAFKQSQQQEQQKFLLTTVNNGKFSNTLSQTNNTLTGASPSNNGTITAPILSDVASTSKGAAATVAAKSSTTAAENIKKNSNNMTVAKYSGGDCNNRLSTVNDLNDHLDTVQDELDSLKDLLRGEGYSIDQNMLMGNEVKSIAATSASAASSLPTLRLSNICSDYAFGAKTEHDNTELLNKLFSDSDLLDNYGLSFPSDNSNDKNKGFELMTYQPVYDFEDIINLNEDKANVDATNVERQLQPQSSSVLNTPYHD